MAQYVVSDVHGCLKSLRSLVESQLQLKISDKLILLGDYVNKGPDSKGVIDYLIYLKTAGYQIICIRGNHDQYLADAAAGKTIPELKPEDLEITLKSFNIKKAIDLPERYKNWLQALPFYVVLPEFVCVHAGFDFTADPWLSTPQTMLTTKSFKADKAKLGGRQLVYGHLPQTLATIQQSLAHKNLPAIGLDGGCVYYKNEGMGNLLALRLKDFKLFVQPNQDQPYKIAVKE